VASNDKTIDGVRKRFLLRQTLRWAFSLDKQHDIKNWYGIAATDEGERLMKRLGFKLIVPHSKSYVLDNLETSSEFLKEFIRKIEAEEDIPIPEANH
jgi:hypothetical protein